MSKILVVGTGGTIACVRQDNILLDNPFKILDSADFKGVSFDCVCPFSVLSENMDIDLWQKLIDCLSAVDYEEYDGVIILHGSDTLAWTGALLGNIFYDKSIVLVAADKPLEDESSNGSVNFERAVEFILSSVKGVYISYNRLYTAVRTVSAGQNDEFLTAGRQLEPVKNPKLSHKNILVINPYVNIDYSNYCLEGVDAVLHTMYHSATVPENVKAFAEKCRGMNIPFYFVTSKSAAEYESTRGIENIIFNSTLENAYARLLLTKRI